MTEKSSCEAGYKTESGNIQSGGNGCFAVGIVYNSEEITTPPSSWEDLWNPDHAGRVILPSAVNSIGVPVFATFNNLAGGTLDDLASGIEKMSDLDVALFFDSSGVANSGFQTGEGVIGAHYATQAFTMADSGLPIGYPLAYFMAFRVQNRWLKRLIYIIVVTPLFTSNIVRAFSWIILLGRNGFVNDLLLWLRVTDKPLPLLFNQVSIVIGLSYIMLPLMVLSVAAIIQNIDMRLKAAARDLGAGPWSTFMYVTLPVSYRAD